MNNHHDVPVLGKMQFQCSSEQVIPVMDQNLVKDLSDKKEKVQLIAEYLRIIWERTDPKM